MNALPQLNHKSTRLPEQIETILVATDFSDASGNAYLYALELAACFGAEIALVHVQTVGAEPRSDIQFERFLSNYRDFERAVVNRLGGNPIKIQPVLQRGEAGEQLLALSEELGADLIIMGTQGAASHDHKILGSVAARLIAKAQCPVLAVPAEASFQPIEQIVYGLAFAEGDKSVIDFLLDFAQPMGAQISCVHISTEPNALEEVELAEYRDLYGNEQSPVYFQMAQSDDLLHALQEVISQVKADVLVMNTRERKLLEKIFDPSLTRAMLMYADLPLLALHV